jgi:hypothetical protein
VIEIIKQSKTFILILIILFTTSFSGCFGNDDDIDYDHTVTRIYSIEIESNTSYTLFIPIVIDQNGISSLMNEVKVESGNAEIKITDTVLGKSLKVSGSGNVKILSKEKFKCKFTEGGEDVLTPPGITRPEKMTLSMSGIYEVSSWPTSKQYYFYNTSSDFELKDRDFAKERMHTLDSIAWKDIENNQSWSYTHVKVENFPENENISINFLLAEDHKFEGWYQLQWYGNWKITNGWNKCYIFQEQHSSA